MCLHFLNTFAIQNVHHVAQEALELNTFINPIIGHHLWHKLKPSSNRSVFKLIISDRALLKIVSMIRKYHNHKPQTTPWHREEEPLNHHETPGRQIKQNNQLSLPHQDDCNTRMDIK